MPNENEKSQNEKQREHAAQLKIERTLMREWGLNRKETRSRLAEMRNDLAARGQQISEVLPGRGRERARILIEEVSLPMKPGPGRPEGKQGGGNASTSTNLPLVTFDVAFDGVAFQYQIPAQLV